MLRYNNTITLVQTMVASQLLNDAYHSCQN